MDRDGLTADPEFSDALVSMVGMSLGELVTSTGLPVPTAVANAEVHAMRENETVPQETTNAWPC